MLPNAASNAKIVVVSTIDRDFSDTDMFDAVWRNAAIRRSLGDIVLVNVASAEFADWFRLERDNTSKVPVTDAKTETGTEPRLGSAAATTSTSAPTEPTP